MPIVLVALQPRSALDYANATTYMQLCNDNICSLPEFTGVAVRVGRKAPETVIGTLHDDPRAEAEVARWCEIAKVLHVVQTEIDDLVRLEREVDAAEAEAKKRQILDMFDTPEPRADPLTRKLTSEDLVCAARAAVALGIGHEAETLRLIGETLGVETAIVSP